MKRLSAHTQPTNLYMCFSMLCPADVEGKCFYFGTNAVSLEGNERLCVLLQIDQMSIKMESSRNITSVSAIDPKVRLQMATSARVSDFKLIKYRLKFKA